MMKKLTSMLQSLADRFPRLAEIFRFAFTGGICFVLDFLCLALMVEYLHVPELIATAIAFLISVVANYVICIRWVFTGAQDSGAGVKVSFFVTSGIGLGLNELFMWLMTGVMGIHYMVAKIISTLLVMVWNYFTKRLVLKRK